MLIFPKYCDLFVKPLVQLNIVNRPILFSFDFVGPCPLQWNPKDEHGSFDQFADSDLWECLEEVTTRIRIHFKDQFHWL